MGCQQSLSSPSPNPNEPTDEQATQDNTATPSSTSKSKLPRSNSTESPYRIRRKNSGSSGGSNSSSKRMLVQRAKLKRSGSSNWTTDRKSKIRNLGRARIKNKDQDSTQPSGDPGNPTSHLGTLGTFID